MRILFYRWKAYNQFDLIQNLEQRGHIVDEITGEMANYESDEPFALSLREQFDRAEYDLVMTVNFFPLISNECEKRRIVFVVENISYDMSVKSSILNYSSGTYSRKY